MASQFPLKAGEEVASTTLSPSSSNTSRNAFTDLMSPKKSSSSKKLPHSDTPRTDPSRTTTFLGRDGLGAYISDPASFPASRVIYWDEQWVVINDLFPKSFIHLLLLSRDPKKMLLHPFEAFEDVDFLMELQKQVKKFKALAAKELKRRYGKYSAIEKVKEKALENDTTPIPEGRDWETEIVSGIHAGPSMNHLHVHILSRDRHSECMRHRKNYNSFATPFLIDVDDFPLDKFDPRRHPGREGFLERDLKCWRCGMNFRNRFARLKEHLTEEFEEWKSL